MSRSVTELLLDNGYEDIVILEDYSYDSAFLGVTLDNRAVYDFDRMCTYLVEEHSFTEEAAVEWIEYNTIRALPYAGPKAPIILYSLQE